MSSPKPGDGGYAGRANAVVHVRADIAPPVKPSPSSREDRVPLFLRDVIAPQDLPRIGDES